MFLSVKDYVYHHLSVGNTKIKIKLIGHLALSIIVNLDLYVYIGGDGGDVVCQWLFVFNTHAMTVILAAFAK